MSRRRRGPVRIGDRRAVAAAVLVIVAAIVLTGLTLAVAGMIRG